jgi:threonyl-tRNA synthetase
MAEKMEEQGLRVKVDTRNESIGYKMRESRNARDSYICVIGEKEAAAGTLSVRSSKTGGMGSINVDDFIADRLEEIKTKAL